MVHSKDFVKVEPLLNYTGVWKWVGPDQSSIEIDGVVFGCLLTDTTLELSGITDGAPAPFKKTYWREPKN